MKSYFIFIISAFIFGVKSSDKDCVWSYKCCKYQEIEGVISCTELCDPLINCDLVQVVEKNSISEDNQEYSIQPAGFAFRPQSRHCKPGYRLDSRGSCRKILR